MADAKELTSTIFIPIASVNKTIQRQFILLAYKIH